MGEGGRLGNCQEHSGSSVPCTQWFSPQRPFRSVGRTGGPSLVRHCPLEAVLRGNKTLVPEHSAMTQDNAVSAQAGALEPGLWASPVSQRLCSLGRWLNPWASGASPPGGDHPLLVETQWWAFGV